MAALSRTRGEASSVPTKSVKDQTARNSESDCNKEHLCVWGAGGEGEHGAEKGELSRNHDKCTNEMMEI